MLVILVGVDGESDTSWGLEVHDVGVTSPSERVLGEVAAIGVFCLESVCSDLLHESEETGAAWATVEP